MLLEHPLLVKKEVSAQWKLPDLDLIELANKYWVQKWSLKKVGKYYQKAPETISKHIKALQVKADKGVKPWVSLVISSKQL